MTRREKLVERLRRARADVPSSDVIRLLEEFGWTFAGQTGSHVRFTRPGEHTFVFPLVRGRRVKVFYVREALRRMGLEE